MANDKNSTGPAALWTAVLGLILPGVGSIGVTMTAAPGHQPQGYVLCVLLFVLLEAVALVCGVLGRHTTTGKTGLGIAATALGLALVLAALWFFLQ
jgi:hypothetical protein